MNRRARSTSFHLSRQQSPRRTLVFDDGLKFNPARTQAAHDRVPARSRAQAPKRGKAICGSDPKIENR
jgi:hypothetical protein